jgi:Conserved TM helix
MIAPVASVLDRAGDGLGDFLPQLAGAFVLLVVGLLVARLVGRLVRRGLLAVGLDEFATRWRITDTLVQARLQPSLAGLIGGAVRITLSVVAAFAALTLLGLQLLSQSLNEAVLFLPNLLAALALHLAGVVLAGLARGRVDRFTYQMDFAVPLGTVRPDLDARDLRARGRRPDRGFGGDPVHRHRHPSGGCGGHVRPRLRAGRTRGGTGLERRALRPRRLPGWANDRRRSDPQHDRRHRARGHRDRHRRWLGTVPSNLLLESMVTIHGTAGPPDRPA